MISEQEKLRREIERMNRIMAILGRIALIVGLFVLLRFVSYSMTPEGGFAGMTLMFTWFLWVPFIFLPVVGVFMAWDRKQKLIARLNELDKQDDNPAA